MRAREYRSPALPSQAQIRAYCNPFASSRFEVTERNFIQAEPMGCNIRLDGKNINNFSLPKDSARSQQGTPVTFQLWEKPDDRQHNQDRPPDAQQ
jgi:hypothetical protein